MDTKTKQHLSLGREYYEKGEFDKAEHYFGFVLKKHRNFADVLHRMGVIYHDRGRFEDARKMFEEALTVNPKYTEAALNLAVTYTDLGMYDEARHVYQESLQRGRKGSGADHLDPFIKGKIANLHGQLAGAYAEVGWVPQAIEELKKATTLCPHFPDLQLKLANLYREKAELPLARKTLESALVHKPQYPPLRIALGIVLLALDMSEEAIIQWEQVLKIDPDNKSARMYLRMADKDGTKRLSKSSLGQKA